MTGFSYRFVLVRNKTPRATPASVHLEAAKEGRRSCAILRRMMPPVPENRVAVVRTRPAYEVYNPPVGAPEIGGATTAAELAFHNLFHTWRLDIEHYGTPTWNPLGALISPGARVLIKPNWVFHENQSGAGLDCLLTHSSVIAASIKYVALTSPAQVVVGDAPIQGCDFEHLRTSAGIDDLVHRLGCQGLKFSITDFRRTILRGKSLGKERTEDVRELAHFVLFDLKQESLLESISNDANKFRVTMYSPDLLRRTHSAGRHQYLIAREVIESDVVINLPKLKTHRKTCITGALKNLVGINGNKEYLPHHRKGGSDSGGDCYAGRSGWKRTAEDVLDLANRQTPGTKQAALAWIAGAAQRVAAKVGSDENLEGSWHGNDTIWRTCLDLQRILRYGTSDGSLAPTQQRTVISVTDAIIGGQGEGPLANTPMPSGFITGALSTAAAEWVHARLMGFDPQKIPLVREAFSCQSYPLAGFSPESITVRVDNAEQSVETVFPFEERAFLPPRGWQGHCELAGSGESLGTESTKPMFVRVNE